MAKIDPSIKEGIEKLNRNDLEKLVLKAASLSKQFHDYMLVTYIDSKHGEKDLFEAAKTDLKILFGKSYRGRSKELQLAEMLSACNKRIVEFSKVCKDKSLEMDLIMEVLKIPFSLPPRHFETCFTKFNYQVYLLVKKTITLLKTKLHEDYYIQYAPEINKYLEFLHQHSAYLDYVYDMPKSV